MVQLQIWVKNMEEKKQIRKQIFAARKAHTDAQIEDWSRMIADRVTTLPEYKDAKRILAYADYNHEVMTGFIIEAAWRDGKEVAVPKVVGQDMIFYKLTDFAQLEKGYFGIPEPAGGEIVQWEDAMMVMPGVAFDREITGSVMAVAFMTASLKNILVSDVWQWHLNFRCFRKYRQNRRISRRRSLLQKNQLIILNKRAEAPGRSCNE